MATIRIQEMAERINGVLTSRGRSTFPHKKWKDHIRDVFSQPSQLLRAWIVALGAIVLFVELPRQILGDSLRGVTWYLAIIAASVALAILFECARYIRRVVPGFENTCAEVQRLAHLQPPKWEFRLAKLLFVHLLGPVDREYRDQIKGQVFVPIQRRLDRTQYLEWEVCRIESHKRLVEVSTTLLIELLPSVLFSDDSSDVDPAKILGAVKSIERLYRDSLEFERQCKEVLPPEGLERLHEYQQRWSESTHGAIWQMFRGLQRLCDINHHESSKNELNITYQIHPNVTRANEEYDRIDWNVDELVESW